MIDIGQSSGWLALQVSMMPRSLGHGQIAARLRDDLATKRKDKLYCNWIESYLTDQYIQVVQQGKAVIERYTVLQSPSRIEELVPVFTRTKRFVLDATCDISIADRV